MAFGKNAGYYEAPKIIPEGIYVGKITEVKENALQGKNCLECKVEIRNFAGYAPNIYRLFDVDPLDDAQHQEWTAKRMSRFCDATGAVMTENGMEYQKIVGVECQFKIGKRQNGYTDFLEILPISKSRMNANRAANANAPKGVSTTDEPNGNDIPF